MATKSRTLTVSIQAQLEIDYNPAELEAMGKNFREFKLGVERTIKADLLPNFQADPHTRIELATLGFPTSRKARKGKNSHYILEGQ